MENKYEITIDYYKFIQTWGWVVDVKSNKMLRYMSTSKRMRDPSIKKKKSSREADAVQSKRRLQTPHQFLFRRCALKKEARKNVRLFVEIWDQAI